jgi:hypothetical protein
LVDLVALLSVHALKSTTLREPARDVVDLVDWQSTGGHNSTLSR